TADELESRFEAATGGTTDGLLMIADSQMQVPPGRVGAFALRRGLPTMLPGRGGISQGGLMTYSANASTAFRRAAYYVDRILNGTQPADLPVEQPTTFDFVINLKTAQALGLTIPQHVLLQATEVIQ